MSSELIEGIGELDIVIRSPKAETCSEIEIAYGLCGVEIMVEPHKLDSSHVDLRTVPEVTPTAELKLGIGRAHV